MQHLKIAIMRSANKWSQLKVAEKIGITKSAYSNIERGKRKPSYDILVKLEDLFKSSHRQLFAVVDETPVSK